MDYAELFSKYKEHTLQGRYIKPADIMPLMEKREFRAIGKSVNGIPLLAYTLGSGKTKILLWSQMHGNESTSTKALFDLFNLLEHGSGLAQQLLEAFTFTFIPMLNPDGALLYTRENANGVDLNRDFHNLSQPESRALVTLFESLAPDFCYNLHDQRSIFGAGNSGKPATISFLAPSYDEERSLNATREKAIEVIVAMDNALQKVIPDMVGRFDDSFNINCAGDNFQFRGVPTILIEAGHFTADYDREITRQYFFTALISGFKQLYENVVVDDVIEKYLNIPQNMIVFFDFVYRNVKINYDGKEIITNFAAQYKEEISKNKLFFNAYIAQIGNLENYFGHFEVDALGSQFQDEFGGSPEIGQKAFFSLGKDVKIVNGLIEM